MSRVAVLAVVLSLLPPACARLMGQAPPPAASDPAPPPLPSATTPPAWNQPEPTTQPAVASSSSASAAPIGGADLVKARAAAEAKDFKRVRLLLEKKVRSGKCAPEESQLVFRACSALKDRVCAAEVKAKHGEDLTE